MKHINKILAFLVALVLTLAILVALMIFDNQNVRAELLEAKKPTNKELYLKQYDEAVEKRKEYEQKQFEYYKKSKEEEKKKLDMEPVIRELEAKVLSKK